MKDSERRFWATRTAIPVRRLVKPSRLQATYFVSIFLCEAVTKASVNGSPTGLSRDMKKTDSMDVDGSSTGLFMQLVVVH